MLPLLAAIALLLAASPARAVVAFSWVTVGEPGNAADDEVMYCCENKIGLPQPTSGYGSVAYRFRIMRTEVPTWAYVEFLNAVAAADPNELLSPYVTTSPYGTITRSGSSGSYTYAAKPGRQDEPVTHMDWFRAARFVNWLHNGQPTGPQDASTTEDGVYTLLGQSPVGVPRNPGARYWITTEDEWYKAAYHVPGGGYVDYGTGSDAYPAGEPPPGGPDSANYCPPESLTQGLPCAPEDSNGPGVATDVGAYPQAQSAWGIQDAVGNLIELFEDQVCCSVTFPGQWMTPARGGFYSKERGDNAAFGRNFALVETNGGFAVGFRVSRPAPHKACGLGAEVALPLGLLTAWRGGRRGLRGRRSGAGKRSSCDDRVDPRRP
jgi:formylglycine-generating enzyme required for sulfatase activity